MKEIIINKCYVGFNLSHKAITLYAKKYYDNYKRK